MLLQDLTRKGPLFLHPCKILQDLARFCGILQESFRNLAQNFCKIPAKFLLIPQDPAGFCKILQGCKKKEPILVRPCKSIFTG